MFSMNLASFKKASRFSRASSRRFFAAFIAMVSLVGLGACRPSGMRPLEELKRQVDAADYIVKRGDTLDIRVWGEPKLSSEVYVRDDGKFTMPLINTVSAEGKPLEQIGKDIEKLLKEYISDTTVTVALRQTAPTKYYLSGSFVKPGEYRSEGSITLLQAIATGGGFAPFANESALTLIRKNTQGEIRYALDYNLVIGGSEPNPELKEGDIIAVK